MRITDAQVHIWAANTPERPWPAAGVGREHMPAPFTADDLLRAMDEAGVHRAVIVPPSWEGDRNDVALAAAEAHPDRLAVMGRLSIEDPSNARLLPDWRKQPGMLGLRFTFHAPEMQAWLSDGTADWLWPAAEKAEVPVMVLPPGQLAAIGRVAERHSGLRLVIDHLAIRNGAKDEEAFAHIPELCGLARFPNIAVKATALPTYTTASYPFRPVHEPVRRIVDAFGPTRVFWGTDITRLPCSYKQAVDLFLEELPFLSAQDKELIMGRGVCEWLGWA
jgi:L-fuconolactonase